MTPTHGDRNSGPWQVDQERIAEGDTYLLKARKVPKFDLNLPIETAQANAPKHVKGIAPLIMAAGGLIGIALLAAITWALT